MAISIWYPSTRCDRSGSRHQTQTEQMGYQEFESRCFSLFHENTQKGMFFHPQADVAWGFKRCSCYSYFFLQGESSEQWTVNPVVRSLKRKVGRTERNQGFTNIIGMAELSFSLKLASELLVHKGHLIPLLFKARLSWILCLLTSIVLI